MKYTAHFKCYKNDMVCFKNGTGASEIEALDRRIDFEKLGYKIEVLCVLKPSEIKEASTVKAKQFTLPKNKDVVPYFIGVFSDNGIEKNIGAYAENKSKAIDYFYILAKKNGWSFINIH